MSEKDRKDSPYAFYGLCALLAFAGVCLAHLGFLAYLAWKTGQTKADQLVSVQELRKYGVIT